MRTQEEINKQVLGLSKMKEELPCFNFFGENNHEPIDASISILQGRSTYEDYADDEYGIESMAYQTRDWLEGDFEEDLFEL